MKIVRQFLGWQQPQERQVDLTQHDALIVELERSLAALRRTQSDPITARYRGDYPPRPEPLHDQEREP